MTASIEAAQGPALAMTTVVVVDDHRTFADLLEIALLGEPDLRCIGAAQTADAAVALIERARPDVVVMDVQLGDDDGIALTRRLTSLHPTLRVVVLSAFVDTPLVWRAADAGACALLPKDGALSETLKALRTAERGGFMLHSTLARRLASSSVIPAQRAPELTHREREVLQMLAEGMETRAIARDLGISVATCRGYVKSLLAKLGAHSQLEAVVCAVRQGLIRVGAPR